MRDPERTGRVRRRGRSVGSKAALVVLFLLAVSPAARAAGDEDGAAEPPSTPVLDEALRHFGHLDASRSLVEILPLLPGLDESERGVGRFLAGVALAELGLDPAAERELTAALDDAAVGGAAAVALARVLSRGGRHHDLLSLAAAAPLDALSPDDRGELAWRAARAAFRERRFALAGRWIGRIPAGSAASPFGTYLAAQAAFARGKPEAALAAARELVAGGGDRVLRDRAAILLGDLETEAGRYAEAAATLAVPGEESPFAARAKRDRLVAEGLARLAAGEFESARPVIDRVGRYLQTLADEVEASVATPEAVEARVRELRGSWPPRFSVYARREWAVGHAHRALEARAARDDPGGIYGAFVRTLGLGRGPGHRPHGDPWLPEREPVARFFYPPQGEVDRLLRALALLEEPVAYHGDACRLRAAVAIRERVARWLLGTTPPPDAPELNVLAGGCGAGSGAAAALTRETRARLAKAVRDEAARVQESFRRDRLELELAIGRAWSGHLETIGRVRREASRDDPPALGLP